MTLTLLPPPPLQGRVHLLQRQLQKMEDPSAKGGGAPQGTDNGPFRPPISVRHQPLSNRHPEAMQDTFCRLCSLLDMGVLIVSGRILHQNPYKLYNNENHSVLIINNNSSGIRCIMLQACSLRLCLFWAGLTYVTSCMISIYMYACSQCVCLPPSLPPCRPWGPAASK